MFSPEHINLLLKEIMARFGEQNDPESSRTNLPRCDKNTAVQNEGNYQDSQCKQNSGKVQNGAKSKKVNITPAKALVLAGILGGVLEVDSVLVDRNQVVQIVLVGSLKQEVEKPKTELEMMIDKIGSMPFEEVMKAMLDRFT